MTSVEFGASTSVYPSGFDWTASATATDPPPPGRFSTATPFGNFFFIDSAMGRATMSTMPPAGYPTMIVSGRSGYWAAAGRNDPRTSTVRRATRTMANLPLENGLGQTNGGCGPGGQVPAVIGAVIGRGLARLRDQCLLVPPLLRAHRA